MWAEIVTHGFRGGPNQHREINLFFHVGGVKYTITMDNRNGNSPHLINARLKVGDNNGSVGIDNGDHLMQLLLGEAAPKGET